MKPLSSIIFGIVGGLGGGWLGYIQRPTFFGWRADFEDVMTRGATYLRDILSQHACQAAFNQMLTYAAIGTVVGVVLGLLVVIATKSKSESDTTRGERLATCGSGSDRQTPVGEPPNERENAAESCKKELVSLDAPSLIGFAFRSGHSEGDPSNEHDVELLSPASGMEQEASSAPTSPVLSTLPVSESSQASILKRLLYVSFALLAACCAIYAVALRATGSGESTSPVVSTDKQAEAKNEPGLSNAVTTPVGQRSPSAPPESQSATKGIPATAKADLASAGQTNTAKPAPTGFGELQLGMTRASLLRMVQTWNAGTVESTRVMNGSLMKLP